MKKKLGEILIAAGAVTRADIEAALSDQNAGEPARLGDLLVSLGKITPLQLARALSQQYGVKFTTVAAVAREVMEAVPMDLQRRFRFLPIKVAQGSISIAMADLSHASSDVLPVLKKRWATVNLFVAPSDEIEAAHAQHVVSGGSGLAPPPPARRSVVTASDDELFAALDLALPSDPGGTAPPVEDLEELEVLSGLEALPSPAPLVENFELEVPDQDPEPFPAGPGRQEEEDGYFFEAAPAALLTTELEAAAPAPSTGERPFGDQRLDLPPTPTSQDPLVGDLFGDAPPTLAPPLDFEVALDSGLLASIPEPAPAMSDDQPFFETAPQAVPIATLADEAFVPDVPMSSGSSLAQLVIQPSPAPLLVVPPVNLPRTPALPVAVPSSAPAPSAPPLVTQPVAAPPVFPPAPRAGAFVRKPSTPTLPIAVNSLTPIPAPEPATPRGSPGGALPAWLQGGAPAGAAEPRWTGALEDLAPSKLVTAVAKALIRRGILSEQDVLDAVEPRKK